MITHVCPLYTRRGCTFVPVHFTPFGRRVLQNTPADSPHFLLCASTRLVSLQSIHCSEYVQVEVIHKIVHFV